MLGTVTALGGGTIRDVIIRAPVFWLVDTNYLLVAVIASLVAFFASRLVKTTYTLLLYLDALGAAMFAIQATDKVLALQFAPAIAVAMGVLTGIGGGLLRDVAGRQTLLMSRDVYATPILLGCLLYVALRNTALASVPILTVSIGFIFCMRAAVSTGTCRCQDGSPTATIWPDPQPSRITKLIGPILVLQSAGPAEVGPGAICRRFRRSYGTANADVEC